MVRLLTLASLVTVISGCGPQTPLERAGIAVKLPSSWRPVHPSTWMVPGTPLAAWLGPDGSSLVIYKTLWVPQASARMLVEATANRLENLPGLKLLTKRVEPVAGAEAARVEVTAPGTGDALAASGLGEPITPAGKTLCPTRRVTLAVARQSDTVYMTWHTPEQSYNRIEPDIRAAIESLRLGSGPVQASYKQ
jgi:hypothetical protein